MKGNPDSVNRGPDIQFGRQKSNGKLRPVPALPQPDYQVAVEDCDHRVRVADHMVVCGSPECPWRTCVECGNSVLITSRDRIKEANR